MYPPGKYIRLGEIIICYPVALAESKEMGIPVENRIVDLAVHGTEHLLGKHHD
jgi:ssRNA-specific RNase YbeY (16S rRNA maturation enzyme)